MRTTMDIEDDVLQAVRSLARAEGRSLGEIVSRILRRGLAPCQESAVRADGFPVFEVPPDAPPLTPETVAEADDAGR